MKERVEPLSIPADSVVLAGFLESPASPQGVIVLADVTGVPQPSPLSLRVARALRRSRFATLVVDLLDAREAVNRRRAFDVTLLARRLEAVADAMARHEETRGLPIGYVGADTAAAAALMASIDDSRVMGIVCRSGRIDLVEGILECVTVPTLLIAGEDDYFVRRLSEAARTRLRCASDLAVVPGGGRSADEPKAIDRIAALARGWLGRLRHPQVLRARGSRRGIRGPTAGLAAVAALA